MSKILIIDNHSDMRQVMLNVLQPENHELSSASDGAEALDKVKYLRPTVVLLDMRLPDMDSIELLKEIKEIIPKSPVIMMCGFGDVESAVGAVKKGAFNYICKPFKIDEVLNIIHEALDIQSLLKEGFPLPVSKYSQPVQQTSLPFYSKSILKHVLIFIILIGVLSQIGLLVISYFSAQFKNESFTVPYSNPTAITYDGTYMWVTDWLTQTFYKHEINKEFSVLHTYYIQDSHPTGIAFDGTYLWSSNAWESLIYKHRLDTALSVIESFTSPCPEPSGLYWDGVYFWICDMGQAKIYKTKIIEEGIVVVDVYDSPGNNPVGIFFDGTYYWIGDARDNQLYKLNTNFTVAGVYLTPQSHDETFKLSSIGWDGKSIWTCSDESQIINRHSLQSLKKINF